MQNQRRKIAVVTGTRADYWLLRPLMKLISSTSGLELQVYATSMHLSRSLGYTLKQVEKDFHITSVVDMDVKEKNSMGDMANSLSMGITGFTGEFEEHAPDIVILLGDRIEQLSAALAATFYAIPIMHLHGGEKSGNLDSMIRNTITKLAHVHFPATKKSAQRIMAMGEDKSRVHIVGALGIESAMNTRFVPKEAIFAKYRLSDKPIISVVYHPESKNWQYAGKEAKNLLEAACMVAKKNGMQVFAIYPNSDAGGHLIIDEIEKLEAAGEIKSAITLSQNEYFTLLKNSAVLLGNTSSGIIEAPFFKLPVINVGSRQDGRERAGNVIDCAAGKNNVADAIKKALSGAFRKKISGISSPYGNGRSSEKIVKVLRQIKINDKLLQK